MITADWFVWFVIGTGIGTLLAGVVYLYLRTRDVARDFAQLVSCHNQLSAYVQELIQKHNNLCEQVNHLNPHHDDSANWWRHGHKPLDDEG